MLSDVILYGADYNPEQWNPETWAEDARLMQEAGVNLVSLGIFSWAKLEPRPGQHDFGWLDRVMDLLHEHGVGVNLANATASPPPWLSTRYPDSRPVTQDGVRLEVGGRQLYCPSHAAFREHALDLTRRIAQRYAEHPALRMWHVNNEYGCHISECYCDLCAHSFRGWLRERYGTLDQLNFAWGTAFWSQQYSDWDEVQPPRRAPTFSNPTQQLDWRRFSSDNLLSLFRQEAAALREHAPHVPLTTNYLGFLKGLDYFAWSAHEDVVSLDAYPDPGDMRSYLDASAMFDLARSLRGGQRWLLMEQAPSAVNWRPRNTPKRPGLMRLHSLQAVAHGANAVMFFQWRASRAGAEKYHSGMVQHVGPERSRVWREVRDLGAELKGLRELTAHAVPARVAVLLDWHSWWGLELDSKPSEDLRLPELLGPWYAAARHLGQNVDFVHPDSDLGGYAAVLAPNLYLLREQSAQNLRGYVRGGGTLVMGYFSGIVDEHDHVQLGGYPALLSDVLGAWVEEWDVMQPGRQGEVRFEDGRTAPVTAWTEVVHLGGAEATATYTHDHHAGEPAVTRHAYGDGRAWYVSTQLPPEELSRLLARALTEAGVPVTSVPEGVDLTVSHGPDGSVVHVLNFHPHGSLEVRLPPGGEGAPGTVLVSPTDALIVKFPHAVNVSQIGLRVRGDDGEPVSGA